MRKNSFRLLKIILGIILFILFLTSLGLLIGLAVTDIDQPAEIIASILGIIITLPGSILNFISAFVLSKNYEVPSRCLHFIDRNNLIKEIVNLIVCGKKIIKISGSSSSGMTELFAFLSRLKKTRQL